MMPPDREHIRTIVVVDGHAEYRHILIDLITCLPALRVVGSGANSADAIELCVRYRPDYLLLDAGMPRFGARRAATAIRALLPATAIILLTNAEVKPLRAAKAHSFADHVISKSDVRDELRAMLGSGGRGDRERTV